MSIVTPVTETKYMEEIMNIPLALGLSLINDLRPVSFRFKEAHQVTNDCLENKHFGFVTSEVKKLLDDRQIKSNYGENTVTQPDLTPHLVKACQELLKMCFDRAKQCSYLENQIEQLDRRIEQLEKKCD